MSTDDRRLSEMIGLDRHRSKEAVWPTNVALACLGAAILWIAFRFLKWNDPRPLYNPWLYAIVTPLILLGISLLLRQFVSRVVERSAQVAFLLSVMVHLVLLVCALDVVIYTRMWPAFFEALAEEREKLIEREQKIPKVHSGSFASTAPGSKKPDYLRYVPTEHQATDTKLSDEARLNLAKNEKADVTSPEVKLETKSEQPFLVERDKPTQSMSITSEAPAALSRSELAMPSPARTRAEAMEAMRSESRAPELTAADTSSSRGRRGDSSSVPEAHAFMEPTSLGPSAPPLGLPNPAQLSAVEPSLAAANVQRPGMADMLAKSDAPRTRSSAIPVPESVSSGTTNVAGLAPAMGASGPTRRTTAGSAAELNMPDASAMAGGASGLGLGNVAGGSLAGRAGLPDGMSAGAGISRGPFSLPRGELGAGAVPGGNGLIDVPDTVAMGAGLAGSENYGVSPSSQASGRLSSEGAGGGQIRLDVDAERGIGGVSLDAGSGPLVARNVPSAPEMALPSLEMGRFSRETIGGPLAGGVTGSVPAPAFQQRIDRLKDEDGGDEGPIGPQTEQAIERGLEFLAKHQRPDGSWKLQDFDKDVLIRSDTAATGLCLLAFQGAGYTHKQYKFAAVNERALKFLIERQKPTGDLYIPQDPASNQNAWLYSHGIAALALCEAYGMTQDPELKGPAQLAVKFMIDSQEPQRGGWRYRPGVGADTSVTGWFMMALKSAQLAGLEVPKSAFEKMGKYVQASQVSTAEPHLFRYNPFAPDTPEQRHGLKPTHVMTSVGLLMRLYLGWKRDLPEMQAGTDYLLEYLPEPGTPQATKRDTYYWYYATQVLFHMGGERWKKWNDKLRPLLLDSQIVEGELTGSWDPYLPSSDLWARYGGRLYVTTLNLLSLEVHYRHLPLYEATAQ